MERYNKSNDRDQLTIQPMCLDDMIPEDAEVRALEVIVEKMNIRSMGFTYSETKQTGRKPYDPEDMFKLYSYSYFNGIRSSRKIERECYRNIELMWLIGEIRPDFKTIADFRKDNKSQIKEAFRRFGMICSELGLIGKEIVAIDGSKFRASNSRLAYHSEKKIEKKIEHHTKMAVQYMKLLDQCDREESERPKLTREEIISKIDRINEKIVSLSLLKEEVSQNGTIYETDPDSRMMKTNDNGADICHNVQIAVDDKNHLVVAVDVTSQPVDREQLFNMASQAKDMLEVDKLTVIADRGYYSSSQFEKCENAGIEAIVAKPILTNENNSDEYRKEAFQYDAVTEGYICPQGHLLKPWRMKETSKSKGSLIYANFAACSGCPVKSRCTSGKKGRTLHDRPLHKFAKIVDKRTQENMAMYHQRKQLVEHPFGTVKRAMGFSYFLTRGNESVRVESILHFWAYNFKRVINLMGTEKLIGALRG